MKRINIGSFNSNGKLIVIDPCYSKLTDGVCLDVKKGEYSAYVVLGNMKDPLFFWDRVDTNYRVGQLIIKHKECPVELVKKFKKSIGVDSGQAGFFNLDTYNKKLPKSVPLKGDQESFYRDEISNSKIQILRAKTCLIEGESNSEYQRVLGFDRFKNAKNQKKLLDEYFNLRIEEAQWSLDDSLKVLESKNFPEYSSLKHSKNFYEIICNLSNQEHYAGTLNDIGCVSRTGIGDGYYKVHTFEDKHGEVVASTITFLEKKELK